MTEQDAKRYYERRWNAEEKANLWAMNRASVILDELSRLGIHRPTVLDLGCGTGWLTEILSQFGAAVGVDLAPGAARRFHPTLEFFDVHDAPPGPFDVVVSQEVIEHVHDPDAYLEEAHRLLRPGGYLILTTPNASVSRRHPEFLVQPTERHMTGPQLRAVLERRFDVLKCYSFFFGYAAFRPYRLQLRLGRWLGLGLHLAAVCARRA